MCRQSELSACEHDCDSTFMARCEVVMLFWDHQSGSRWVLLHAIDIFRYWRLRRVHSRCSRHPKLSAVTAIQHANMAAWPQTRHVVLSHPICTIRSVEGVVNS